MSRQMSAPLPRGESEAAADSEAFGALLKVFRADAGLSQEALAERANVSVAAISALERGTRRAPYRETVAMLAEALGLGEQRRVRFESAADRARGRGAPATSDPAPARRLPQYLTSFVGRDADLREAERLVAQHRLVTLTGAGGIGKTRTALQVASSLPASVCEEPPAFADLATVSDGRFVVSVLATAVGASLSEQEISADALAARLKSRSVFVVMDNCEHVIADAAKAARTLLHACSGVRILATSRERLGVSGEVVLRLPSLAVPEVAPTDVEHALSFAAVRLFVERARLSDARFALTKDRIALISDICRRLDGIPLAIELAATRSTALGLRGLSDRLHSHFAGSGGARDAPTRQQTMQATIAWSYDLLDDVERGVLRRLSIFAGGFTLDAAAAICSDVFGEVSISESEFPEVLASLVDKSLVDVALEVDSARFRLLESVRTFLRERFEDVGERDACMRRHAQWLVALSERLSARPASTAKSSWNAEVAPEFDNIRAVLDWALMSANADDAVLAGAIVGGYRSIWVQTGRRMELQRLAENAIVRIDAPRHPLVVARLYWALMYSTTGAATFAAAKKAIELYERGGDRYGTAAVYGQLGYHYCRHGSYAEAEACLETAASIVREHRRDQTLLYAGILRITAWVMHARGNISGARAQLAEATRIAQAVGDDLALVQMSACLAEVEFADGNLEAAVRLEETILAQTLDRADGNRSAVEALCNLACLRLMIGNLSAAEAAARNALRRADGRYPTLTPWAIQHFAAVAARRGEAARAARLLGYIDAWCDEHEFVRLPIEQASYTVLASSLRGQLMEQEMLAFAQSGRMMGFERAAQEVLAAGL